MGNVQYIIIAGEDTALNQQTVIAMLGVIASIIGAYFFGATWDDNNKREVASRFEAMSESEEV